MWPNEKKAIDEYAASPGHKVTPLYAATLPEAAREESVTLPKPVYQAALNYIQHVGANHVMRGEPHPQQWIVDGLLAAAPSPNEEKS